MPTNKFDIQTLYTFMSSLYLCIWFNENKYIYIYILYIYLYVGIFILYNSATKQMKEREFIESGA